MNKNFAKTIDFLISFVYNNIVSLGCSFKLHSFITNKT